jgi:tRNA-Thr(GGU) m(6)t(6)A37 methyltransferase TsaA
MRRVSYKPIGIIHSPLKQPVGAPIQAISAMNVRGTIEVFPKYLRGLKDIEGFSHLIIVYHLHLSRKASLIVKPYLDDVKHGIFATRAPARPNPIGISIVRLTGLNDGMLRVQGLDVVDGTPLLDIKPYIPRFDVRRGVKFGWCESRLGNLRSARADKRFSK